MKRLPWILLFLITAVLLLSLGLNAVLYRFSWHYYRQYNAVTLNPLAMDFYPSHAEPAQRPRVVLFGDSRAYDWPPPDLPAVEFVNRGIQGQTSVQSAMRFDAHIRPLQPDIVVVQVGVNDLDAIPALPHAADELVANCKANVGDIVGRSRQMGAQVILTTVFPLGPISLERRLVWSPRVAGALDEVNAHIHSLAGEGVTVLDTAAVLAGEDGVVRPAFSRDFLHLTETGYAALNEQLVPLLQGLID